MLLVMLLLLMIEWQLERGGLPLPLPYAGWAGVGVVVGGVAATRLPIWAVLAMVGLYIFKKASVRAGLIVTGVALLVFVALVGPFVIWNSAVFFEFAPIGVNLGKLGSDDTDDFMKLVWLLATAASVAGFGWKARNGQELTLGVAVIMAIVVAAQRLIRNSSGIYLMPNWCLFQHSFYCPEKK